MPTDPTKPKTDGDNASTRDMGLGLVVALASGLGLREYGMAGVAIAMLAAAVVVLWRRGDRRDAEMNALKTEQRDTLLDALGASTRAVSEAAIVIRENSAMINAVKQHIEDEAANRKTDTIVNPSRLHGLWMMGLGALLLLTAGCTTDTATRTVERRVGIEGGQTTDVRIERQTIAKAETSVDVSAAMSALLAAAEGRWTAALGTAVRPLLDRPAPAPAPTLEAMSQEIDRRMAAATAKLLPSIDAARAAADAAKPQTVTGNPTLDTLLAAAVAYLTSKTGIAAARRLKTAPTRSA